MKGKDVLHIIKIKTSEQFTPLEEAILIGSWQGKSYQEISREQGYSQKYIKDIGSSLWKTLSNSFQTKLSKAKFRTNFEQFLAANQASKQSVFHDWGKAPNLPFFVGRSHELETLKYWIIEEKSRLICISGIKGTGKTSLSLKLCRGGIGKTDLAINLAKSVTHNFDIIIWRSLINCPSLNSTVSDWIQRITELGHIDLPDGISSSSEKLLWLVTQKRCLLILDNYESILQEQTTPPQYRESFKEYGQLLTFIGEATHQSCILLTSREIPPELSQQQLAQTTRLFALSGLNTGHCQDIFNQVASFHGSTQDWESINQLYNGNPLALELAAKHIHEVYEDNLPAFLSQNYLLFEDINSLLNWHFQRLSPQEIEIALWLTINREARSIQELREDVINSESKKDIPSTLQSLQRKVPLEKGDGNFSLQPVIIEYLTQHLIQMWGNELNTTDFKYLNQYSIIKARTQENIRTVQAALLMEPTLAHLKSQSRGNKSHFMTTLLSWISDLQLNNQYPPGYLAGNLINLLIHTGADLRGTDLSNLYIRQGYFQETNLANVNFANSTLIDTCFQQYFDDIFSSSYSPDGSIVAIGDANGYINLIQVSNYQYILRFQANQTGFWENAVQYSADGKYLFSGGFDNKVKQWNAKSGDLLYVFHGHEAAIWTLKISPDGRYLASAGDDHTIKIWDIHTKECVWTLKGHQNAVRCLAFTSNGHQIASGSHDNTLKIWDLLTGRCLKTMHHPHWVLSVAFSKSNHELISTSAQSIWIWDVITEQVIRTLDDHRHFLLSMSLSPDQRLMATSSLDGVIKLWDLDRYECLRTIDSHTDWVFTLTFNPQGNTLFSSGYDQTMRFWDIKTGDCLSRLQGYCNCVYSVSCSPRYPFIASGHKDSYIRIWNIQDGTCLHEHSGQKAIHSVAFSPDGQIVASGNRDNLMHLWDLESGACLSTLSLGQTAGGIWSLDFSSDGLQLASGSQDGCIRIWDPYSGQLIMMLQEHQNWIWKVVFSSSRQWLASACHDKSVILWDLENGCKYKTFSDNHDQYMDVDFSPDNCWLAMASHLHGVLLWNMHTQEMMKLKGHIGPVISLAFSPDNRFLASGGSDQHIKIWDVQTQQLTTSLASHQGMILSLSFDMNGNLVSGSNDGSIHVWDIKHRYLIQSLRPPRPYENMNISGIQGIHPSQIEVMKLLGALTEAS